MTKKDFCDLVLQAMKPADKLIAMVPTDELTWKPGPTFMSAGQVICHLSDGLGLEMLATGKWPSAEEMEAGTKLENMPSCSVPEALERLAKDKAALQKTLDGMSEDDFANRVVSVPWGWKGKFEVLAVGFLGHFNNHKMQLFIYLKLLGLPVNTETLYGG